MMSRGLKRKYRTFRFVNQIDEYGTMPGPRLWINDVLDSREIDELYVFDPNDEDALSCVFNEAGEELLEERATFAISISEWFPIACQAIRWAQLDEFTNDDTVGRYGNNAPTVLWPNIICPTIGEVQGPSAFVAEIIIKCDPKWFGLPSNKLSENSFKCIVAHELVHAFNMMKFLVPSFINWRSFLKNFSGGSDGPDVARRYSYISSFLDDYGSQLELNAIQKYWPSQAKKWFKAFRRPTPKCKNTKRNRK